MANSEQRTVKGDGKKNGNDVQKTVADLTEYTANPRKISSSDQRILAKGIEEYGDLSGVVFNVRNGMLVGGNQRSKVLSKSDEITVEHRYKTPTKAGTVAEGFILHGGEKYRYREVDWDPKRHAAACLMANKAGGEWDWSLVTPMLANLENELGLDDMELTGFNDVELENILGADPAIAGEDQGPGRETDRGQSQEDSLQNYEDASLRKIEIWLDSGEYPGYIKRLDKLLEKTGIQSYSELFPHMLQALEERVDDEQHADIDDEDNIEEGEVVSDD